MSAPLICCTSSRPTHCLTDWRPSILLPVSLLAAGHTGESAAFKARVFCCYLWVFFLSFSLSFTQITSSAALPPSLRRHRAANTLLQICPNPSSQLPYPRPHYPKALAVISCIVTVRRIHSERAQSIFIMSPAKPMHTSQSAGEALMHGLSHRGLTQSSLRGKWEKSLFLSNAWYICSHMLAHLLFLRQSPASFLPGFLFLCFSLSLLFETLIFTFHISGLWSGLCGAHHHASASTQPWATISFCQSKYSPAHQRPASFLNYTSQIESCRLQKGKVCVWMVIGLGGHWFKSQIHTSSLDSLSAQTHHACLCSPRLSLSLVLLGPLKSGFLNSLSSPTLVIRNYTPIAAPIGPACLISPERFGASPSDWLINSLRGQEKKRERKKWDIDVTQAFSVTVEEWKHSAVFFFISA